MIDRLLAPAAAPQIDDTAGEGPPQWLAGATHRVLAAPRPTGGAGELVERFTAADGRTFDLRSENGRVAAPFSFDDAYLNLVHERWRGVEEPRALSARQLALFYAVKRFIPRALQLRGRRLLIRLQGEPEFPRWPLDESVAGLLELYAQCVLLAEGVAELPFRWFWPDGATGAVVLTHDVESAEGLRLAVELADLEEERGLRSSFNIVADWYPIDWGIVDDLRRRGFELGVHGVHHDRSMFSSKEEFAAQQPAVRAMAERLGAEGFRSPAMHRVIDWLGELPTDYDSSVPHSDPYEPIPGGCCSLWPFFIGNVVELPYTLPQDHTLLTLLGHTTPDLWLRQLDAIARLHGMALILTHPDPGYLGDLRKRAIYAQFLDAVAARADLWCALPRDVARWWRARDSGADSRLRAGTIRLDDGRVVFAR